jgi:hypothetical protein
MAMRKGMMPRVQLGGIVKEKNLSLENETTE